MSTSTTSTSSGSSRREYGTGSIYQRSSDGRWFGVIDTGWNPNGTRRRTTVSAATKAAVKVKLRRKTRELEEGASGAGTSTRTTVKAWADDWLEIAERDLRPAIEMRALASGERGQADVEGGVVDPQLERGLLVVGLVPGQGVTDAPDRGHEQPAERSPDERKTSLSRGATLRATTTSSSPGALNGDIRCARHCRASAPLGC